MPDHSTMVRTPKVSVVIPAFNAEKYLGEALRSVREQTLRDVEVIVVDDGSSDGTVALTEQFASTMEVTVLRQANAGPSAARNAGIRSARGRYCAFLDADDVMLPELLEAQSSVLDSDPDLGWVLTDVSTFDESGTIHTRRWSGSSLSSSTLLDRLVLENFVTTSAVMAPTTRLCEVGLFPVDRRVAEDYELWLRLASRWKTAYIDRPLVRYRYRGDGLSANRLYAATCALEVIEAFWREHPDLSRANSRLAHHSLARHLANVGAAAASQGDRKAAAAYFVRSLRHHPSDVSTWKSLVKAALRPAIARKRAINEPSGLAI